MKYPYLLQTATKKCAGNYTFTSHFLISQAIHYDQLRHISKTIISSSTLYSWSFEDWFKSKYEGFVQSRLDNGTINLESLRQDFSYSFIRGSWSSLPNNGQILGEKIDIFNSSSYANKALANRLRRYKLKHTRLYVHKTIV